ncbi:MAG: nuclear transport factor 2 family protein [Prosthecobacter sp.]
MKALLIAITFLLTFNVLAEDAKVTALTAADEARTAAMKSADREKLNAIFSAELRYAHSSGVVDTKASFIEVLTTGRTKYVGYDVVERTFTFPAPGIALMAGRSRVQAETATGKMDSVLSYLAVWREENGQWRFLAWQSCKLPPATP